MKNTNDFRKCKVGDKLWSIQLGECEVTNIQCGILELTNNIKNSSEYYLDGKESGRDFIQSLYFSNPNIIAPEKPKEKILFDLEKALSGEYDLVTRDGREVQEWKWFEKADQDEDCISYVANGSLVTVHIYGNYWNDKSSYDFDLFLIEK